MVYFSKEKPSFRNKKGYSYVIFHDTGEERYCKKAYASVANALSGISHCPWPDVREDTKDTDIFSVYDVESGKVLKHARFTRIEVDNYHYYKLESSDPEEESFV